MNLKEKEKKDGRKENDMLHVKIQTINRIFLKQKENEKIYNELQETPNTIDTVIHIERSYISTLLHV